MSARESGDRPAARVRAVQFATGVNAGSGRLGVSVERAINYGLRNATKGSEVGLVPINEQVAKEVAKEVANEVEAALEE